MRDDEYQRTAKALARETRMSDASAARIEQKLLRAIEDRELPVSHSLTWLPPSAFARSASAHRRSLGEGWLGGRKWLVAAAAVVLVGGSISLWTVSHMTVNSTTSERTASEKPSALADVVLPLAPKPAVVTSAKAPRGSRPAHRTQTAHVVRPNGFVELPWTAGLPAFESGEIVRVEVPVASLPAYGFDISRGTNRSVQADVLVGQDGLARAMRLVTNSARSTQ